MDKRIKKLWIEALKSGKYPKTSQTLRDTTGYCCLGVLCDLYMKDHPKASWHKYPERSFYAFLTAPTMIPDVDNAEDGVTCLAKKVADWAGLDSTNPEEDGEFVSAINDRNPDFEDAIIFIEEKL